MSQDDDLLSQLHRTDPWIAAITVERIAKALEGFPLPLAEGCDWMGLARGIQNAANFARGTPPQGNVAAKAELEKLAKQTNALRSGIERLDETSEIAAFWEVFRFESERRGAKQIDYDDDYKPLIIHPLETIENILARAASQLGTRRKPAPGWRKKDAQERRIGFVIALTPIFQESFDTPARANNWRAEYGEEHPWPEFYRRIYSELFPEAERLNLPEVLQVAARQLPLVEAMKHRLDEQEAARSKDSGK